jgi:hypothetical protein
MYMCPISNGFRDEAILLHISKIIREIEISRTFLIPVFIVQETKLVQFA